MPGGLQENEVKAFMKNLEQIESEPANIRIKN